jgi:hypothetical protein
LRNKNSSSTNKWTLDELLTLEQVVTGDEPEVVTYRLPISYDTLEAMGVATNDFPGYLKLLMDSDPDDFFLNAPECKEINCAKNGDCLLLWNTACEHPGQHAMQAFIRIELGEDKKIEIRGPVKPFFSSNLCRFDPGSSLWGATGAYVDAYDLVEPSAIYSVEIKTKSGAHLKTFKGKTTKGVIQVDWNLVDDRGMKCTNNSFLSYFHIKMLKSGRSQTLRQTQNKVGTSGD